MQAGWVRLSFVRGGVQAERSGEAMEIANNILKHYLKNVYFITGTAYAGKSTAVKMLAERFGMICCGENFHSAVSDFIASPERQPNIHYLNTLTDWKQFVTRSPEEYAKWAAGVAREAAQFEVAALISLPKDRKAIVDTNIPVGILKEISDFRRVAVMLSPQSMSVERFFERGDAEKQRAAKTPTPFSKTSGGGLRLSIPAKLMRNLRAAGFSRS